MLARAGVRGSKIFLKDESGGKPDDNPPCPRLELSSSLLDRVGYMKELETEYGFKFSAVSIDEADLEDDPIKKQGIEALKNMLGVL